MIRGAGTDLAAPIYDEVGNLLRARGITLDYQLSVSSRAIAEFRAGAVAFVSSQDTQAGARLPRPRRGTSLYVPVAFEAVAVIYSLPSLSTPLHLDGGALADIYLGRLRRWNASEIARQNPGVRLPPTSITIVHRSDAATDTGLLTAYMAAHSARWRKAAGTGTELSWPAGTAVTGDPSMRDIVSQTPGAIGYTDQSAALQNKLETARMRNPSGSYEAPTLRTTTAVGEQRHAPHDLSISTIDAPVADAYPIASELYLLTFHDLCEGGLSQPEALATQRFLDYLLGAGQSVLSRLSFAPLPSDLRSSARAVIRHLRCRAIAVA